MKVEDQLLAIDAKGTFNFKDFEYVIGKTHEAVELLRLGELDNGYRRCRFCKSTTHDGEEQTHKPDCAAQKWLEG